MRALLIAAALILLFIFFSAMRAITGDALSAVVLGLILLVTVISWFAGLPVAAKKLKRS